MMPSKILTAALGSLLLLALAFVGLQTVRLANERETHAQSKQAHAEQRETWERKTREAVESARAEEQRRAEALQGVIHEVEQNLAQARADADAASDSGERLRKRLSAITAACRVGTSNPASASAGPTTEASGDLLADVQRRLDEAQDRIAEFADKAHAAGKACERSHGTLTAPDPLSR